MARLDQPAVNRDRLRAEKFIGFRVLEQPVSYRTQVALVFVIHKWNAPLDRPPKGGAFGMKRIRMINEPASNGCHPA